MNIFFLYLYKIWGKIYLPQKLYTCRKNFKFLHKTPLFINYEVNNLTVSLIYDKKLLGIYENLNKNYSDFTISAGCFDFRTESFKYPETYFEDIENKRLTPNSDLNNQFPANLLKRIKKFKAS